MGSVYGARVSLRGTLAPLKMTRGNEVWRVERIAAPSLCPRMRLIVDVHHVLDRELRVTLCGGQALMPEQFLDGAQVRSLFQHVRAEGMTECMRMNLGRQSLGDCDALDDAAHAARGEASAALVDEQRGHASRRNCFLQRVLRRVIQSGEQLLAPRQVNGKRRKRRPSEGDVA